jgi:hypothetical protein
MAAGALRLAETLPKQSGIGLKSAGGQAGRQKKPKLHAYKSGGGRNPKRKQPVEPGFRAVYRQTFGLTVVIFVV